MTVFSTTGVVPQPDALTEPFWSAAARHELVVQRCMECGKLRFPPAANCTQCSSEAVEWHRVSGRGTVFAYTWVHQAFMPQFKELVPYNVSRIALEDDPSVIMMSNVVDVPRGALRVGLAVEVVFDDVETAVSVPRWRPSAGRA